MCEKKRTRSSQNNVNDEDRVKRTSDRGSRERRSEDDGGQGWGGLVYIACINQS